jgi:hypothetical protein
LTDVSGTLDDRATRSLAALNIDELEERAYRLLLVDPMLTAPEVAKVLATAPGVAETLLEAMRAKGLVTRTDNEPHRYLATPPRFAIDALVSQRQAELQRARLAIPELERAAKSAEGSADGEKLVEIITSRSTLQQIVTHLHRTAQHEIFGFQRLPSSTTHQEEARPGVRMRSISDPEYLEAPGSLSALRKVVALGEEARVFHTLPVKMFVADRRMGLVLNAGELEGSVLIVRSSPLLDALCALFELIWERATPIAFTGAGELDVRPSASAALGKANQRIITMLAAGFNDKAIAYEAGISLTTVNRRIAELMSFFDARTRFQLGWHAAMALAPSADVTREPS